MRTLIRYANARYAGIDRASRGPLELGRFAQFAHRPASMTGRHGGCERRTNDRVGPDDQCARRPQDRSSRAGRRGTRRGRCRRWHLRSAVCDGPNYYAPTVLVNVGATMACSREETFGPVVPITRFIDEQEMITAPPTRRSVLPLTSIQPACAVSGAYPTRSRAA